MVVSLSAGGLGLGWLSERVRLLSVLSFCYGAADAEEADILESAMDSVVWFLLLRHK